MLSVARFAIRNGKYASRIVKPNHIKCCNRDFVRGFVSKVDVSHDVKNITGNIDVNSASDSQLTSTKGHNQSMNQSESEALNSLSHLTQMSHDEVYFLDATMVISYMENSIPEWSIFVDEHFRQGKRMYLMSLTFEKEIKNNFDKFDAGLLPACFEVLYLSPHIEKSKENLHDIYNEVLKEFEITNPKLALKYKNSIKAIVYAGYFSTFITNENVIINDAVVKPKVVFASGNLKVIQRLLKTEGQKERLRNIVKLNGYEHLATVRYIGSNGTYEDY